MGTARTVTPGWISTTIWIPTVAQQVMTERPRRRVACVVFGRSSPDFARSSAEFGKSSATAPGPGPGPDVPTERPVAPPPPSQAEGGPAFPRRRREFEFNDEDGPQYEQRVGADGKREWVEVVSRSQATRLVQPHASCRRRSSSRWWHSGGTATRSPPSSYPRSS